MTKQTEKAAAAQNSGADAPATPVQSEAGPASGDIAVSGQSLTLEQIRASGLDPAVYGYAPDA